MMKAEFEEMIGKSVVDEEYKVIEAVYTWHPAINDTTGKENVEAMRIQLFFEGKPEPEVRDILKSNGFRWAPSVGAWQRQLNNNGKYAVKRVIRELEEMEAAE